MQSAKLIIQFDHSGSEFIVKIYQLLKIIISNLN